MYTRKAHNLISIFRFWSIGLLFFLIIGINALQAEWRTYHSKKTPATLIKSFIEQMDKQGQRFQIKKFFNEKRDAKQGFVMQLLPTGSICHISFHVNIKNQKPKSTLIKVFTQSQHDAKLINKILATKMKMQEIGKVSKNYPSKSKRAWPRP